MVALPGAAERRRRGRLAAQPHDAGAGPERRVVEALAVRAGAPFAVAADGGVDQRRVGGAQRLRVDAPALALHQVGDEDVGVLAEPAHQLGRAGLPQVDADRALAAVVEFEAVLDRRGLLEAHRARVEVPPGIAPRRLDLDHVGPEVGEQRRRRGRRQPRRRLDHADARQRGRHRAPPAPAATPPATRLSLKRAARSALGRKTNFLPMRVLVKRPSASSPSRSARAVA